MEIREKIFTIRFTLSAEIPESILEADDFEEDAWLHEWEVAIKPNLLRTVFTQLRSFSQWEAHVRNRGISPAEEIEIVVQRRFNHPSTPPGGTMH